MSRCQVVVGPHINKKDNSWISYSICWLKFGHDGLHWWWEVLEPKRWRENPIFLSNFEAGFEDPTSIEGC